jgi:hypothetical protein
METLKILAVLALATGMMVTSCKKETSSPAKSPTSLGVKLQATNKSFTLLKSALATTPSFTWDTSYIVVSKIEFEAEKRESEMARDSSEVHFEWDGPKKIDLFSLTSVVGDISLLSGVYHEISLKISALKADAGSSPVFYLSGTYTNSVDSVIPIAVIVNENFEFKVKKEGSSLDATSDYTSLINLNLTLLMSGITSTDLNSATRTNGKIIISSTSNAALYSKINTNLSTCAESEISKGKESESGNGSGNSNSNGNGNGSDPYSY